MEEVDNKTHHVLQKFFETIDLIEDPTEIKKKKVWLHMDASIGGYVPPYNAEK